MKKILLASSALVLVGGAAFAEVTLSGSAEMGIYGVEIDNTAADPAEPFDSTDVDAQFWTDMDVTFTLSGETETGVSFGAAIDLDDATENGGIFETADSDFAVFVSGDFGTVTMGDTDGAFDWAIQDTNFGMPGTLVDNEEHIGYDGMNLLDGFYDGQIARYDYSFGDFAFAISAEIDDDRSDTAEAGTEDDPMAGIGAKYNLALASGTIAFGAAYQGTDSSDNYIAGVSVAATFGGLKAGLAYYDGTVLGLTAGLNDDGTNVELSAGGEDSTTKSDISYVGGSIAYTFDAITVGVNGGTYDDIPGVTDLYGYGITAAYDLGGGLELQAGWGRSEGKDTAGEITIDSYSLGLAMSF